VSVSQTLWLLIEAIMLNFVYIHLATIMLKIKPA